MMKKLLPVAALVLGIAFIAGYQYRVEILDALCGTTPPAPSAQIVEALENDAMILDVRMYVETRREDANLILIHELRHAALDYIANTYNIPEDKRLTISREEHLFDAQDYMNRKQARKVKPSIPKTYAEPEKQQVSSSAASLASTRKQLQMYQDLAQKVLQDRKVPKRTKSKEVEGFVTRAMGLLGL